MADQDEKDLLHWANSCGPRIFFFFFFFNPLFFILLRLFVVKFQIDCTHTRLKYGRNLQETHSTFTISHLFRGNVKLKIEGEMAIEETY